MNTAARYSSIDDDNVPPLGNADVARSRIRPSPTNPRTVFRGLGELAASIEVNGVRVRLVVRRVDLVDGCDLELIHGERRYRASETAGLDILPVEIVDMTDDQVLHEQLVEIGCRSDLTELEEGQLYRDRVARGQTVRDLAALVGKSEATIRDRIALTRLAPGPMASLAEGLIPAAVATLIAAIPDAAIQQQAHDAMFRTVFDADNRQVNEVVSYREARLIIRRFHRVLRPSLFDLADATLDAEAGPCTTCPHRVETSCVHTPCFDRKARAAFDAKAAEANRQGLIVLDGPDERRVFVGDGATHTASDSPYVDLDEELPFDLAEETGKSTWRQLAGRKPPPAVLVRDGTGAARTLYSREAILAKAKEAGLLVEPENAPRATKGSKEYKEERAKAAEKLALQHRVTAAVLAAIAAKASAEAKSGKAELERMRWLVGAVVQLVGDNAHQLVAADRQLTDGKGVNAESDALLSLVGRAKDVGALLGLATELLAAQFAPTATAAAAEPYEAAIELYGVDVKAVGAEVAAAAKAEKKAAEAAAKDEGKAAKKGKAK